MAEIATTNRRNANPTVREWTIALGVLTSGNMSRADAEMKLRAYVPLLEDNFPPEAFTRDSLHRVASRCKWFPSYAEVVEHLGEWWRPRRPPLVALSPPEPVPPRAAELATEEERAYVRAKVAELEAHLNANRQDALTAKATGPRPAHLSPGVLDAINPLPNGRRRAAAT